MLYFDEPCSIWFISSLLKSFSIRKKNCNCQIIFQIISYTLGRFEIYSGFIILVIWILLPFFLYLKDFIYLAFPTPLFRSKKNEYILKNSIFYLFSPCITSIILHLVTLFHDKIGYIYIYGYFLRAQYLRKKFEWTKLSYNFF